MVRRLDLHRKSETDSLRIDGLLTLLRNCENAEEIRCNVTGFDRLCARPVARPKLEVLELELDADARYNHATMKNAPAIMPNLKRLEISGYPRPSMMQLFANDFPHLACIDADLVYFLMDWEPGIIPRGIAAKIRRWTSYDSGFLVHFIRANPLFAPDTIFCNDEESMDSELWNEICRFKSLRSLYASKFDSSLLFQGMPPNLQILKISDLRLYRRASRAACRCWSRRARSPTFLIEGTNEAKHTTFCSSSLFFGRRDEETGNAGICGGAASLDGFFVFRASGIFESGRRDGISVSTES